MEQGNSKISMNTISLNLKEKSASSNEEQRNVFSAITSFMNSEKACKRRQLSMDDFILKKKIKKDLSKKCIVSELKSTIIDLTEDIMPDSTTCINTEAFDISVGKDKFNHLSENEALRKLSSESGHKAEYETGYDSMAENLKETQPDSTSNCCDLYSIDSPIQLSPLENSSMSSNEDFLVSFPGKCSRVSSDKERDLTSPASSHLVHPCPYAGHGRIINTDIQPGSEENVDLEVSSTPLSQHSERECETPESWNTSLMLQKLQEAGSKVAITPRKVKLKGFKPSLFEDGIENETPVVEESSVEDIPVTFTLNRIIKDQKENKNLKAMEENLLAYLKKGGFSKDLQESSDEETSDHTDETYDNMSRIINSTEDCEGLPAQHKSVSLFSRKRLFCCFCQHNISRGETILPFLHKLDIRAQLTVVKENCDIVLQYLLLPSNLETESESAFLLFDWLLQVLSTSTEVDILTLTEAVLSSLVSNPTFHPSGAVSSFSKVLLNMGVQKKYVKLCGFKQEKFISHSCKKCRLKKRNLGVAPHDIICFVLRVFIQFLSCHPKTFADRELEKLVTFFLFLLCETQRKVHLQNLVSRSIHMGLEAMQDWPGMCSSIVTSLSVIDIQTAQYIVSMLPCISQRLLELRRGLSLHFVRSVAGMDGLDEELDIELIESLASELTTSKIPTSSSPASFNTLWCSVKLLQVCLANEPIENQHRNNLESITKSFQSLSLAVRENGSLYKSETKHHLRLATAINELKLQDLSRKQPFQQGIFKFLRTSKVEEEIVEDCSS